MIVNVGFGNCINSEKLLAILWTDAAPVKRIITIAREENKLLDATAGRRTKAVLCMENGYYVLSALQPDTLAKRAGQINLSEDSDSMEELEL